MAGNTATFATYADFASRDGFDPATRKIIEYQSQTNRVLDDMLITEANEKTRCVTTVRTKLPEVAWRMLNRGVKAGKSETSQVSFTSGGMEALAKVDERMLKLNGGIGSEKANDWRLGENSAYQQSMNKKMALTTFYGDEKISPAGFTGLGAYYYSTDITKCSAADYVIDAGGTGDNLTSIYFIVWGQNQIHGFYPQGTTLGFEYRDNGRQKAYDDDGGELYAYESQYNWDLGIAVRDYRYGVRICNLDLATITGDDLVDYLIDGYNRLEDPDAGKAAIYLNRQAMTRVDQLVAKKVNVNMTVDMFAGKKTTHFWGMPFRRCDGILRTESKLA
ncbi:hypothetical protein SOV_17360 [Sporomusa ovata DSM 2662]|uniref:Phage protein n=1 Tax=Sporomusa ovata TaxID=2378 RepID=A0A0U1KVA9_9FIRM|nr:hypothetical protein [Sporomusa ovata]EQB29336.1 hypothetical protein SOV_1c10690 [Sporomusa ovata DSM 2662]CQR71377.1 Phage protein [Sporomusa ovata]